MNLWNIRYYTYIIENYTSNLSMFTLQNIYFINKSILRYTCIFISALFIKLLA